MKARLPLPSRGGLFALLMIASAVVMVLPTRWTGNLKCARQVLLPFQDGMTALADGPGPSDSSRASVSEAEYHELLRQIEARNNQIVALNLMLRELEAERPAVQLILDKLVSRTASQEGRLIPARVIARDSAAWRDTLVLARGSAHGVREDAWASSRVLDAGGKDGVEQGMLVLAREYLLGRIREVTPYTARLVLLSDVESREPVWIGRVEDGRFRVLPSPEAIREGKQWAGSGKEASFLAAGQGSGKILVSGVHEDYVDRQVLAVDDLVVSAGTSAELPVTMVIGRVVKIQDDPAQRQLRQLVVRCPVRPGDLRWVYVIDTPPTLRSRAD